MYFSQELPDVYIRVRQLREQHDSGNRREERVAGDKDVRPEQRTAAEGNIRKRRQPELRV